VTITSEAVRGHAAKVLLDAATESDLLVIGSRGHGGFGGALLGTVSHYVVAHAGCPVVVVPDNQPTAGRSEG
jgi:nucleotide-binding universal stress UspA family protein